MELQSFGKRAQVLMHYADVVERAGDATTISTFFADGKCAMVKCYRFGI